MEIFDTENDDKNQENKDNEGVNNENKNEDEKDKSQDEQEKRQEENQTNRAISSNITQIDKSEDIGKHNIICFLDQTRFPVA